MKMTLIKVITLTLLGVNVQGISIVHRPDDELVQLNTDAETMLDAQADVKNEVEENCNLGIPGGQQSKKIALLQTGSEAALYEGSEIDLAADAEARAKGAISTLVAALDDEMNGSGQFSFGMGFLVGFTEDLLGDAGNLINCVLKVDGWIGSIMFVNDSVKAGYESSGQTRAKHYEAAAYTLLGVFRTLSEDLATCKALRGSKSGQKIIELFAKTIIPSLSLTAGSGGTLMLANSVANTAGIAESCYQLARKAKKKADGHEMTYADMYVIGKEVGEIMQDLTVATVPSLAGTWGNLEALGHMVAQDLASQINFAKIEQVAFVSRCKLFGYRGAACQKYRSDAAAQLIADRDAYAAGNRKKCHDRNKKISFELFNLRSDVQLIYMWTGNRYQPVVDHKGNIFKLCGGKCNNTKVKLPGFYRNASVYTVDESTGIMTSYHDDCYTYGHWPWKQSTRLITN